MTPEKHRSLIRMANHLIRLAQNPPRRDLADLHSLVQEHFGYEAVRAEMARAFVSAFLRESPRQDIFALSDGTDVTGLVVDLLRANGGWQEANEDRASLFLNEGRGAAREVGQKLDAIGGWAAMSAMSEIVTLLLGGVAARELSAAWDGIGQWRD